MESDNIHIIHWLKPLAWLYGCGVALRNKLFDLHILRERSYPLPIICIGNLTVGGTGKTPHTEYLLRLLQPSHKVAVLSRGYKRKSRGFQVASKKTPMSIVGDEPWQMKKKFPKAIVAVDANRREGIERLTKTHQPQVILLDDALQHRYVKAGLNILLTDYHRLINDDYLLPAGRLREPQSSKERAQIVIVTKCPSTMAPLDYRILSKSLSIHPCQHLFFTTMQYGELYHIDNGKKGKHCLTSETHVLLLTGIATPRQMLQDLEQQTKHITPLFFPDHHVFTPQDIQHIEQTFAALPATNRMVVTTEKDAARLSHVEGLSTDLRQHLYVLPIKVAFLQDGENFNQCILNFIKTYQ